MNPTIGRKKKKEQEQAIHTESFIFLNMKNKPGYDNTLKI